MLDELERLEQAATPGPHRVSLKLGGCEVVDGCGEWLAEFERAEDAEHYAAARNALPALLRVARAAQRYADAEGFADILRDALNTPGAAVDQKRVAASVQEVIDARFALGMALAALVKEAP